MSARNTDVSKDWPYFSIRGQNITVEIGLKNYFRRTNFRKQKLSQFSQILGFFAIEILVRPIRESLCSQKFFEKWFCCIDFPFFKFCRPKTLKYLSIKVGMKSIDFIVFSKLMLANIMLTANSLKFMPAKKLFSFYSRKFMSWILRFFDLEKLF